MWFAEIFSFVAQLTAFIGVLIIAYATCKSFYLYVRGMSGESVDINRIRLEFGYSLILALEFVVGADIIESIAKPNYYDLGLLAGLVLIRTFLSYFLNKELENLEPEMKRKVTDVSQ